MFDKTTAIETAYSHIRNALNTNHEFLMKILEGIAKDIKALREENNKRGEESGKLMAATPPLELRWEPKPIDQFLDALCKHLGVEYVQIETRDGLTNEIRSTERKFVPKKKVL